MPFRKKTKIAFAYTLLAASGLSLTAYDAHLRSLPPATSSQTCRIISQEPAMPLAITPLSESPFPEARPKRFDVNESALASNESTLKSKRAKTAATSEVYFLKVAVQVDSGQGPVALHRGTRVLLVRQQDGKLLVTRNGTDFLIEKSQVTNDLNSLARLARNPS